MSPIQGHSSSSAFAQSAVAKLLLFATPIAILALVLQVPANRPLVASPEMQLAPVDVTQIDETGAFIPPPQRRPRPIDLTEAIPQQPKTVVPVLFESARQPTAPSQPPLAHPPIAAAFQLASTSQNNVNQLRELSEKYWSDPPTRSQNADQLNLLADAIYFSSQTHYVAPRIVKPGETLADIAAENAVTWEYLAELNNIEPKRLRAGTPLKVIPGPFEAIIERRRHRLTVHAHGYFVAAFDVGLGRPNHLGQTSTPVGHFQVSERISNPTWYGPDRVIDADDPQNPLGEYWLGLADQQGRPTTLGIHGTIAPWSIGHDASNGCVRLRAADIERLFRLLPVGAQVEIRD